PREMKTERLRTARGPRDNLFEDPIVSGPDQRSVLLASRILSDAQRQSADGNSLKSETRVIVRFNFRKQQRGVRTALRGESRQALDDFAARAASALWRHREHGTDAADPERMTVKYAVEFV